MTDYGLRRRNGDWWVGAGEWTDDVTQAKRFETASAAVFEATTTPAIGIDWNWKLLPPKRKEPKK